MRLPEGVRCPQPTSKHGHTGAFCGLRCLWGIQGVEPEDAKKQDHGTAVFSVCFGQHLPSTEQAEGAGAVRGLLEIPHAACNQTSCIVGVKQWKEPFLPHHHPAAFTQACSESPAEELRCTRQDLHQASCTSAVRTRLPCGWEASSQSGGKVGWTPLCSVCSSFYIMFVYRRTCQMPSPLELAQEGVEESPGKLHRAKSLSVDTKTFLPRQLTVKASSELHTLSVGT